MVTPHFDVDDEIRILNHLLDTYCRQLPKEHFDEILHYFSVGENEITFEYIFLELLERNIPLRRGEKSELRDLGLHMKMDQNNWNDGQFWEKFEFYLGAHQD